MGIGMRRWLIHTGMYMQNAAGFWSHEMVLLDVRLGLMKKHAGYIMQMGLVRRSASCGGTVRGGDKSGCSQMAQ
jgi:hypothetical protein